MTHMHTHGHLRTYIHTHMCTITVFTSGQLSAHGLLVEDANSNIDESPLSHDEVREVVAKLRARKAADI